MHVQEKERLCIKRLPLNKLGTYQYPDPSSPEVSESEVRHEPVDRPIRGMYGFHGGNIVGEYPGFKIGKYPSGSEKLYSGDSQFREGTRYGKIAFVQTQGDVDYAFNLYLNNENCFDGTDEISTANRVSLINLAYNVFGSDWYTSMRNTFTLYKGSHNIRYSFDLLKDTIAMIYSKPQRHPLSYHLALISDYMNNTLIKQENGGNSNPIPKEDFIKTLPIDIGYGGTKELIRSILIKGGFPFLMVVLNTLFGAIAVREEAMYN